MSAVGEARARRLLTLLAAIEEDLGAASSSVKELERLDAVQDDALRAAARADMDRFSAFVRRLAGASGEP